MQNQISLWYYLGSWGLECSHWKSQEIGVEAKLGTLSTELSPYNFKKHEHTYYLLLVCEICRSWYFTQYKIQYLHQFFFILQGYHVFVFFFKVLSHLVISHIHFFPTFIFKLIHICFWQAKSLNWRQYSDS